MKTSFAAPIREELVVKRNEAAEKWTAFEQRRDHFKSEGTDLAKDEEALKELTELSGAYSTAKDECLALEEKLFQALAIDTTGDGVKDRGDLGKAFDEITGGKGREVWTPGGRLTESDVYKALRESGVLEKSKSRVEMTPVEVASRDEFKALITGLSDTSGGAFLQADRIGYFPMLTRPDVIANLVTVGSTDSDMVEWVEETGFTNAAAEVAEAVSLVTGAKPESALTYAIVQSTVKTIAHWIPATKRALSDIGQLRTLVDQRLRDGVRLRLEAQMVNGDGVGENLLGILNTPGIGSVAVGVAPDNRLHALLRAITAIRLAFMEPTGVVMHPNDWMDVRLMRDASGASADTGGYLYGPPSQTGPMFVWGVPVYVSAVVPEGNPLVGKFDEAMLWVREGVTVSATDSHADFFIRNLVAILAEGRFAFGVPRPEAFAEVTGA